MDEVKGDIEESQFSLELTPATLERLNLFSQQMSQAAKNIGHILQSAGETYFKLFEVISPELTRFAAQYQKYLNRKSIYHTFNECGLWLAPSMTPGLVKEVIDKYELGKKRAVSALIEGYYRRNNYENLKHAVNSWNRYEYFSPRMQIITDALNAHISKKWTLTIPALLPHIEGIAGEILLANGLAFKSDSIVVEKGYKTYPSFLYGSLDASKVTPTMDIIINSLLYYLEGTLYAYQNFKDYPKIRRLPKLNRHAIMHGYQINYATRLNSLRCFLALDSLSMLKGNIPKLV